MISFVDDRLRILRDLDFDALDIRDRKVFVVYDADVLPVLITELSTVSEVDVTFDSDGLIIVGISSPCFLFEVKLSISFPTSCGLFSISFLFGDWYMTLSTMLSIYPNEFVFLCCCRDESLLFKRDAFDDRFLCGNITLFLVENVELRLFIESCIVGISIFETELPSILFII